MIDILIFSKDRACQLDLCLRTLEEKFPCNMVSSFTVQYTYSNDSFKSGYDLLKNKHKVVKFAKEDNFETKFKSIVEDFSEKFCLFLVDDDVFINKINKQELQELLNVYESNNIYHSLSLRMNPKINYCYPAKTSIKSPKLNIKDFYFIWNWTQAENQHYCWGYPMAIDCHIYKTQWFKNKIKDLKFSNPNSLESKLNGNRDRNKPEMLSFNESKVFSIQNNFVQGKRNGETHNGADINFLNKEFLKGKIINTKNIYGIKKTMAHGELEYVLK